MYLCTRNYDLKRGGTFETAKAGTFHSVTAGTSIPLFTTYRRWELREWIVIRRRGRRRLDGEMSLEQIAK